MLTVGCKAQVSYKINATGQKVAYNIEGEEIALPQKGDALYGQDANYCGDEEMSFKDNSDGTVLDVNTGLIWQQTPPLEGMTWAEAKEYCENLELGGYTDWRLPTLKELFSISDFSEGWPYIDTTYFKLSSGVVTKDEQYWADNKYVGETVEGRDDAAFGVNHVTGHIKAYPAGSSMPAVGERTRDNNENNGQRRRQPKREGMQGARDSLHLLRKGAQGDESQLPPPPRGEGFDADGDSLPQLRKGAQGERSRPMRPSDGGEGASELKQSPLVREGLGDDELHERPQMRDGMMPPPGGGAGGGRPFNNPMAKQVRAVRGTPYGENNFKDNGDGTISDIATGLMWAKDDSAEAVEWGDALQYAENAEMAGYSDWRLPNVKELQSIVDYSRAPSSKGVEAAIDPIFNCTPFVNEAGDNDYGYYWTGTSACFTKGRPFFFAWYVAFGRAVNNEGKDFHGAGAVRFDSKADNGVAVEGGEERYYNFVRLVRDL